MSEFVDIFIKQSLFTNCGTYSNRIKGDNFLVGIKS